MKPAQAYEPHLVVNRMSLLQGGEWRPAFSGWLFIGLSRGTAYFMHPLTNVELTPGAALIVSAAFQGTIRSSRLEETQFHYFRLDPKALTGIATVGEQRALQQAAAEPQAAVRLLEPSHPAAERFTGLCRSGSCDNLPGRLQLLGLFIQGLGVELKSTPAECRPSPDAKARLAQILNRIPAAELMHMDFLDLAGQMCCTPRHLSRTFHQVVGTSFREKQTEVRLARAKQLLTDTEAKILDVALESGYQSLSLFNLMFKKYTGLTPRAWRDQAAKHRPAVGGRRRVGLVKAI